MGVILAIGNAVWEKEVGALFQSFLPWDPPVDNFLFSAFLSFWSYVIILNTVVPISLYVRWEVEQDVWREMYSIMDSCECIAFVQKRKRVKVEWLKWQHITIF